MKKTALTAALLVFASALLLSSCDAMFNTNLFKAAGLGQVDITKASTPAEIAAAATSPQFFTDLKSDATTKDNMLTTLVPGYSSGTVPTAIDLQAALTSGTATADNLVLASAIMINTTEAGTIVKNIAQELPSIASATSTTSPDISAIVKAVLPADVLSDPVAFSAAINALSDASSSLTAVAQYVGSTGTLPSVPGGTSQDTAYYGLVALAVSSVASADTTLYPTPADALYAVVNGTATATSALTTSTLDITSSTSTASILLSAAGIDLAALAK